MVDTKKYSPSSSDISSVISHISARMAQTSYSSIPVPLDTYSTVKFIGVTKSSNKYLLIPGTVKAFQDFHTARAII